MKNTLKIVLFLLVFIPFLSNAQNEPQFLQDLPGSSEIFIEQVGVENEVIATQSSVGGVLYTTAYQRGELNSITLELAGKNLINGFYQSGNGNSIDLTVNGQNIGGVVVQKGDDNTVERSLAGDGGGFIFTQFGNGHQILQEGPTPTELNGLEIRQQGIVGMTVIVTNN